ncbi:MAG: hypothetical protein J4N84_08905 [Chloroflexi bacterium]|nr:hypothetical protein [Chloroflexota bacterium]
MSRMRGLAAILGVAVLMVFGAACGSGTEPASAKDEASTTGTTTTDVDAEPGKSAEDPAGIGALQIDGVWVFQHQPEFAMNALHGGTPEIVDGCLVIGNTIVVWHVDRIDEAAGAISAVKSGESPRLLIGGGGISLDEGARPDQIPAVITGRCPTSAVWFGAP